MAKVIVALLVLVILLVTAFFVFGNIRNIPFVSKQATVTINNHVFSVEVAKTTTEKEKGLSGRNSLTPNHGMYFPFDTPGFYPFWMKDMKFPIDIIYIANGKVVTVYKNVKPAADPYSTVVKPTQPTDSVLEINAGEAEKYTTKNGDTVQTNL